MSIEQKCDSSEYEKVGLEVVVDGPPTSMQSKTKYKKYYKEQISSKLSNVDWIFCDDVNINITWCHNENVRFFNDSYCDLDNIVKPIFDSLCGLSGIMIDDSQVQSYSCEFLGMYLDDTIVIKICGFARSVREKKDLVFAQIINAMYIPINVKKFKTAIDILLYIDAVEKMYAAAYKLARIDEKFFSCSRPEVRLFHRSKIHEFQCFKKQEFEKYITKFYGTV